MNRFRSLAFFLFCFSSSLHANYLTSTNIKQYENVLLKRVNDLREGLSQAWVSGMLASCANAAAGALSWTTGTTVTPLQLKMFPMLTHFPNKATLSQDFQTWIDALKPERIAEINVRLVEGKKNKYDSDLFNLNIQHPLTVKRFFSGETLTVEQLNEKIKTVSTSDYVDEMFVRLFSDVVYQQI